MIHPQDQIECCKIPQTLLTETRLSTVCIYNVIVKVCWSWYLSSYFQKLLGSPTDQWSLELPTHQKLLRDFWTHGREWNRPPLKPLPIRRWILSRVNIIWVVVCAVSACGTYNVHVYGRGTGRTTTTMSCVAVFHPTDHAPGNKYVKLCPLSSNLAALSFVGSTARPPDDRVQFISRISGN